MNTESVLPQGQAAQVDQQQLNQLIEQHQQLLPYLTVLRQEGLMNLEIDPPGIPQKISHHGLELFPESARQVPPVAAMSKENAGPNDVTASLVTEPQPHTHSWWQGVQEYTRRTDSHVHVGKGTYAAIKAVPLAMQPPVNRETPVGSVATPTSQVYPTPTASAAAAGRLNYREGYKPSWHREAARNAAQAPPQETLFGGGAAIHTNPQLTASVRYAPGPPTASDSSRASSHSSRASSLSLSEPSRPPKAPSPEVRTALRTSLLLTASSPTAPSLASSRRIVDNPSASSLSAAASPKARAAVSAAAPASAPSTAALTAADTRSENASALLSLAQQAVQRPTSTLDDRPLPNPRRCTAVARPPASPPSTAGHDTLGAGMAVVSALPQVLSPCAVPDATTGADCSTAARLTPPQVASGSAPETVPGPTVAHSTPPRTPPMQSPASISQATRAMLVAAKEKAAAEARAAVAALAAVAATATDNVSASGTASVRKRCVEADNDRDESSMGGSSDCARAGMRAADTLPTGVPLPATAASLPRGNAVLDRHGSERSPGPSMTPQNASAYSSPAFSESPLRASTDSIVLSGISSASPSPLKASRLQLLKTITDLEAEHRREAAKLAAAHSADLVPAMAAPCLTQENAPLAELLGTYQRSMTPEAVPVAGGIGHQSPSSRHRCLVDSPPPSPIPPLLQPSDSSRSPTTRASSVRCSDGSAATLRESIQSLATRMSMEVLAPCVPTAAGTGAASPPSAAAATMRPPSRRRNIEPTLAQSAGAGTTTAPERAGTARLKRPLTEWSPLKRQLPPADEVADAPTSLLPAAAPAATSTSPPIPPVLAPLPPPLTPSKSDANLPPPATAAPPLPRSDCMHSGADRPPWLPPPLDKTLVQPPISKLLNMPAAPQATPAPAFTCAPTLLPPPPCSTDLVQIHPNITAAAADENAGAEAGPCFPQRLTLEEVARWELYDTEGEAAAEIDASSTLLMRPAYSESCSLAAAPLVKRGLDDGASSMSGPSAVLLEGREEPRCLAVPVNLGKATDAPAGTCTAAARSELTTDGDLRQWADDCGVDEYGSFLPRPEQCAPSPPPVIATFTEPAPPLPSPLPPRVPEALREVAPAVATLAHTACPPPSSPLGSGEWIPRGRSSLPACLSSSLPDANALGPTATSLPPLPLLPNRVARNQCRSASAAMAVEAEERRCVEALRTHLAAKHVVQQHIVRRCALRWYRLRLAVYFAAWVAAPDLATVCAVQVARAQRHRCNHLAHAALRGLADAVTRRMLRLMAVTLWVRPQSHRMFVRFHQGVSVSVSNSALFTRAMAHRRQRYLGAAVAGWRARIPQMVDARKRKAMAKRSSDVVHGRLQDAYNRRLRTSALLGWAAHTVRRGLLRARQARLPRLWLRRWSAATGTARALQGRVDVARRAGRRRALCDRLAGWRRVVRRCGALRAAVFTAWEERAEAGAAAHARAAALTARRQQHMCAASLRGWATTAGTQRALARGANQKRQRRSLARWGMSVALGRRHRRLLLQALTLMTQSRLSKAMDTWRAWFARRALLTQRLQRFLVQSGGCTRERVFAAWVGVVEGAEVAVADAAAWRLESLQRCALRLWRRAAARADYQRAVLDERRAKAAAVALTAWRRRAALHVVHRAKVEACRERIAVRVGCTLLAAWATWAERRACKRLASSIYVTGLAVAALRAWRDECVLRALAAANRQAGLQAWLVATRALRWRRTRDRGRVLHAWRRRVAVVHAARAHWLDTTARAALRVWVVAAAGAARRQAGEAAQAQRTTQREFARWRALAMAARCATAAATRAALQGWRTVSAAAGPARLRTSALATRTRRTWAQRRALAAWALACSACANEAAAALRWRDERLQCDLAAAAAAGAAALLAAKGVAEGDAFAAWQAEGAREWRVRRLGEALFLRRVCAALGSWCQYAADRADRARRGVRSDAYYVSVQQNRLLSRRVISWRQIMSKKEGLLALGRAHKNPACAEVGRARWHAHEAQHGARRAALGRWVTDPNIVATTVPTMAAWLAWHLAVSNSTLQQELWVLAAKKRCWRLVTDVFLAWKFYAHAMQTTPSTPQPSPCGIGDGGRATSPSAFTFNCRADTDADTNSHVQSPATSPTRQWSERSLPASTRHIISAAPTSSPPAATVGGALVSRTTTTTTMGATTTSSFEVVPPARPRPRRRDPSPTTLDEFRMQLRQVYGDVDDDNDGGRAPPAPATPSVFHRFTTHGVGAPSPNRAAALRASSPLRHGAQRAGSASPLLPPERTALGEESSRTRPAATAAAAKLDAKARVARAAALSTAVRATANRLRQEMEDSPGRQPATASSGLRLQRISFDGWHSSPTTATAPTGESCSDGGFVGRWARRVAKHPAGAAGDGAPQSPSAVAFGSPQSVRASPDHGGAPAAFLPHARSFVPIMTHVAQSQAQH